MIGTGLQIIPPERTEIAGADAERLPTVRTSAKRDDELIEVWLKTHADGSGHTIRAYGRIGRRFISAIERGGVDLRHATIDHVQTALEGMRIKEDGSLASSATV